MALRDVRTDRLRLERWDPARHTPALAAINALPEAVRYLNDGVPYTREETERQSARFSTHWSEHGFGLWAATVVATARTIGFVGVAHPLWFADLAHEVEIGWRLHPDAWGHGYATEAGRAALAAARDELGLERIIAVIDPGNAPSLAVARRLGMSHERTLPHPQRPGDIEIRLAARSECARAAWWRPESGEVPSAARPDRSVLPELTAGGRGGSGAAPCRAMNRRGAHLRPGRDHPWTAPAATMIERSTMRVPGGGGGRGRGRCLRGCLTQRDELQGRIHGPAHQLAKRALVLATFDHRREHVFVRLRVGSDGKLRERPGSRGPDSRIQRRRAERAASA